MMKLKISMILTVVGIMALCLIAMKPLTNHAVAATACNLTIKADPGSGSLAVGESIGQHLSGNLSCDGKGLDGATIHITGLSSSQSVKTDSTGEWKYTFLANAGKSYTIHATFDGDSGHSKASAETTIHIKEKNSGRFTQP